MAEISFHPADFAYKNLLTSLENRKVSSSVPAKEPTMLTSLFFYRPIMNNRHKKIKSLDERLA